ncbi:MAG: hypothetical protein JWN30_43 [Bacilli bacterium]|nr:hypothetical protein [Bacilli bacterium]
MSSTAHQELLQRFEQGVEALEQAIQGLTEEQLLFHKAAGKWSIKQIAIHVADTELAISFRLRNILSVDRPPVQPFDQDKWTEGLHYEQQDLATALSYFKILRQGNVALLQSISDSDWQRVGVHPSMGDVTLESLVQLYTKHVYNHVEQIKQSLAAQQNG